MRGYRAEPVDHDDQPTEEGAMALMHLALDDHEVSSWKKEAAAAALARARTALDLPATARVRFFRSPRYADFDAHPYGDPRWRAWKGIGRLNGEPSGMYDPAEPATLWVNLAVPTEGIDRVVYHEAAHCDQRATGQVLVLSRAEREADAEWWAEALWTASRPRCRHHVHNAHSA